MTKLQSEIINSFRAVVVDGDKKGKIGIGVDKGKDVSQAIEKATEEGIQIGKRLARGEVREWVDKYEIHNQEEQRQFAVVLENVFEKLGINISKAENQKYIKMLQDGMGEYAIRLTSKIEQDMLKILQSEGK